MTAFIQWLVKKVILPMIMSVLMAVYSRFKKLKDLERKAKKNEQAADQYDTNPTTDTYNNLP